MESVDKDRRFGLFMLFLAALIYFFANLQKVIVPGATFDELQHAFSLDAASVTRLGSAFLYTYAAAQLVVGVLADRFGGERIIIFGGALFCAGSLLSALECSLPLLYFSRFLTGMGAAAIYLSIVKEIGRVIPHAIPIAVGIITVIGYSGAITGASPFIAGVSRLGYRNMMLATALVTILIYLIYAVSAARDRGMPPVCREVKFNLGAYLAVIRSRQNCFLIIAIGISFGSFFALQSIIGKKFLEDYGGMSEHAAGIELTASMIIAALNGFFLASISGLIGNRRRPVMIFSGAGCFVGALMIFLMVKFDLHCGWAVAGMLLMAFAGNVSPIYVALIRESNDDNRFGTVLCVGNCLAYGISALLGGVSGMLMDVYEPTVVGNVKIYGQQSYLLVFGVFTLLGAVALLLSLGIRESYGRRIDWNAD